MVYIKKQTNKQTNKNIYIYIYIYAKQELYKIG